MFSWVLSPFENIKYLSKPENLSCSKVPGVGIQNDRIQTRSQQSNPKKKIRGPHTEKLVKNCSNLVIMIGCTDLNSFWAISRSGKLGSLFRLLCCDPGSNVVVLNTHIWYFLTT